MIKKLLILFSIFLIIIPAYAVSDIEITPEHPKVGDTITITGKANPNEEIPCQAWFEITPIISPPYYGYIMEDVEIPITPNNFKVIAENVNNLNVYVKMGFWIKKSATANDEGIAVVSQSNVPPGTYEIRIGGTIKDPSKPVKLKIIASTTIKADENGNFEYSYRANNIPAGTVVHLNIGGIQKDILIESDIPTPPPIVTDNNTTNETVDKEPPKITILSPTKREFNYSKVNFDIVVEDDSPYSVDIYLNGNKISYNKINNHYTGTLTLNVGENTLKIIAVDNYSNRNEKILHLIYKKATTNNESSLNEKLESSSIKVTTNDNKNPIKEVNNNNQNNKPKENIVEGTIIKHIGENATLIIQHGTKITKDGEIQIKEIHLPNITLAYYISPKGAEFSIPLTLKVKIGNIKNKEIKVLYYDEKLKSWVNIPYIVDKENNIVIKINKSGYYAIKEKEINVNEVNKEPIYMQIIELIKAVINIIIHKMFNFFNF